MASQVESAPVTNGQETEQVISAAVYGDGAVKLLGDAVREVPAQAVKELFSLGVCIRCIFRLVGVHDIIYSHALLSPSILNSMLEKATSSEGDVVNDGSKVLDGSSIVHSSQELELQSNFCTICLGILQFIYRDHQEMLVKRDHANDFALTIAKAVKHEGYDITDFSLEVSVPSLIVENEQAIFLCMKKKYGSELWFQEKFLSGHISVKDVFKLCITPPLETLLGAKSGQSSFLLRFTYTHPDTYPNVQNMMGKGHPNKRMKTDAELQSRDRYVTADIEDSDCEGNKLASKSLLDHGISDCSNSHLKKVQQPCQMTFVCCRTPIYIGGRYLKYSRNVSQTRWIIDDERKGEASVEELIGSNILPVCRGDSYKFHAAGREDIDVRMLGSGRPFLVEIQNARQLPSEVSVKEIEKKINSMENKLVRVKNIKVLGSQGWSLMREGEAEKQKQYAALVWISRSIKDDDLQTISSLKDLTILQKTPIRVLHRRSPLERERVIHWMKIERIAGSSQYFLLHLCTQAGTYIKEYVHGDLGRSHPSIGSILGCRAEILQLDVTDVKMDCFLAE